MKIFIPKNWEKLRSEISKLGKVVAVRKGVEGEQVVIEKNRVLIVAKLHPRIVVEMLADLGYDFVALIDFDREEIVGIDIPVVSSIEDVMHAEDYETLKSLVGKVKSTKGSERCGAIGIFVGFVRKISNGRDVLRLEYEKYENVYADKLREVEEGLKKYPGIVDTKIYHKAGVLAPGEDIIYVVVMGEHRRDIWRPLEESMELVKKKLPIWKKEVYVDGEIWVHNK
jgi:molybdopterin synthase catalytic subunit